MNGAEAFAIWMARSAIFDDLTISDVAQNAVQFGISRATALDAIRFAVRNELIIVRPQGRFDTPHPDLEAQLPEIEALLPLAENDSMIFDFYFRASPAGKAAGKALQKSDLNGYPWAQGEANWDYNF